MSAPRVVVIAKRTEYGRLVEEEHDPHVLRLIERKDASVADWKRAHAVHVKTLSAVERALKRLGARFWVLHGPRTVFDTTDAALIVTVGGDGTLLAASHNVTGVPILGINSSPEFSVGFFCAGEADNLAALLAGALEGTLPERRLTRMQVSVAGRVVTRRVLNEALFCHVSPAAASRYILSHRGGREGQLSSGVWVCTAAGSTGAARSAGGETMPLSSTSLEVVVREPFASMGRNPSMTKFFVPSGDSASIVSKMMEGCVFLDGPFHRVPVRIGDTVEVKASDDPVVVLGLDGERANAVAPRPTSRRARGKKK